MKGLLNIWLAFVGNVMLANKIDLIVAGATAVYFIVQTYYSIKDHNRKKKKKKKSN